MKYLYVLSLSLLLGCGETSYKAATVMQEDPLPILGIPKEVNGIDIPHSIPDFAFVNQDSTIVNNATFDGKAYVTDFFFTSCPTICPKVKKQMLRLYDKYQEEDRLVLLSHSIDTKRDTVGKLREYANNLEVSAKKWHFVTGEKDKIYEIADDYFSIVTDDPEAPGGFDHSGRVILIDKNRHVRSFADGTNAKEMDRLMRDIDLLLAEKDEE